MSALLARNVAAWSVMDLRKFSCAAVARCVSWASFNRSCPSAVSAYMT